MLTLSFNFRGFTSHTRWKVEKLEPYHCPEIGECLKTKWKKKKRVCWLLNTDVNTLQTLNLKVVSLQIQHGEKKKTGNVSLSKYFWTALLISPKFNPDIFTVSANFWRGFCFFKKKKKKVTYVHIELIQSPRGLKECSRGGRKAMTHVYVLSFSHYGAFQIDSLRANSPRKKVFLKTLLLKSDAL